jgi:hypothetical protein
MVPVPGFTGVVLLTCAAFWLQKSISPLEGWAAQAVPARVPIVRMPVPMNLQNFIGPSFDSIKGKFNVKFRSNREGEQGRTHLALYFAFRTS